MKSGSNRTESSASQIPLFLTSSDWTLPKELPNLSNARLIGLDTETYDPDLKSKGPAVRRGGYMVGISVAVEEGHKWYIPFGHSEGQQFNKETVIRWAKENLCKPNQPKIGANILYDLDYLYHAGIHVTGPFYDVQIAEPLIDENTRSYSLNALAKKYLGETKNEELLTNICNDFGYKGKPQEHIWKLDPKYVGPYAEDDAWQALQIFKEQCAILRKEELIKVFNVETRLIPMILYMRQIGVPIDMDHLFQMYDQKQTLLIQKIKELNDEAGMEIDYWAAESIARAFDKLGKKYPLTPKTRKPSFVKDWLNNQDFPLAQKIVECRTLDKFIGTFIQGSMMEMMINGRIHCQFHQMRSDDFGTVTGRFSSSNPNLQFIPARTKEGKEIRECFIPDEGYGWCKADMSQIEIRILAHYAMGKGSDEVRKAFNDNPNIDYHQWCADTAKVDRRFAKTINFGLIYGMGIDKLANQLGISVEEATLFRQVYFNYLPFIHRTVSTATQVATSRGYIKTILGRRRRFPYWEPKDNTLAELIKQKKNRKNLENQILSYVNSRPGNFKNLKTQRAGCYKAFNAADQGSAADIMKKSMVDVWEAGLCSVIKPYITVHDELDFGYPLTKEGKEAVKEVKFIMENTVKLKVPLVTDVELGTNWGNVK